MASMTSTSAVILIALAFIPICSADGCTTPRRNISSRVDDLRALFPQNNNIAAYIIPSEDAHLSEYVSDHDRRRAFISGFTGSAGTAAVALPTAQTPIAAALFTDGRYYTQAEAELDCTVWRLVKSGMSGEPSLHEWLANTVPANSKVGGDPTLHSKSGWNRIKDGLAARGVTLVEIKPNNLVDTVWGSSQPPRPNTTVFELEIQFSGRSWQDKVADVRKELTTANRDFLVVTALDEIAWLFNIRASDVPNTPYLYAFAVVPVNEPVRFYIESFRLSSALRTHLAIGGTGLNSIILKDYSQFFTDLATVQGRPWIGTDTPYAVTAQLTSGDIHEKRSPIQLMKSIKNDVEIAGMRAANLRDSASRVIHAAWMYKQMKAGASLTEISVADKLEEIYSKGENYKELSFDTIAGSGPNAAIIHYRADETTNRAITKTDVLLLDAGSQYLDGTTDVTRTHWFGDTDAPKNVKEAYTRVLQGSIDLMRAKFPTGTYGRNVDAYARRALWGVMQDYRHGTGHGIGAFLSVHEGPQSIGQGLGSGNDAPLTPGMFESVEPGYYEPGNFGIRLETDVVCVRLGNTSDGTFLGLDPVTLLPFERSLIIVEMLSSEQLNWLNEYHAKVRQLVGPKLSGDDLTFLNQLTEPIKAAGHNCPPEGSGGATTKPALLLLALLATLALS